MISKNLKLTYLILLLYLSNVVTYLFASDAGVSLPYVNLNYLVLILCALFFRNRIALYICTILFSYIFFISLLKIILLKFNLSGDIGFIFRQFNYFSLGFILNLYLKNLKLEMGFLDSGDNLLYTLILSFFIAIGLCFLRKRKSLRGFLIFFICTEILLFSLLLLFYVRGLFTSATILTIFVVISVFSVMQKLHEITPKLKLRDFIGLNILICLVAFSVDQYNNRVLDHALFPKSYIYKAAEFKFTANINSASDILFDKLKTGDIKNYDNVILIVVESLGLAKDHDLQKMLSDVFLDKKIQDNYEVISRNIPFFGSTTPAEFRELCGKKFNANYPKSTDKDKLLGCLPSLFSKNEFSTYGIHNSNHYFYHRSMWYDNLGFDNIIFAEEMESHYGLQTIYGPPFPGVRENEVFDVVLKDILKKPERKFLYFLTIESHIPVFSDMNRNGFSKIAGDNPILKNDKQIRGMYEMYYNIFYHVSKLAKEMSGKKNIFIIVGDHKPPFTVNEESELFDDTNVPFFVLISK